MPGEVNCKELNGVKKPMVRKTTERNTAGERVYGPVTSPMEPSCLTALSVLLLGWYN